MQSEFCRFGVVERQLNTLGQKIDTACLLATIALNGWSRYFFFQDAMKAVVEDWCDVFPAAERLSEELLSKVVKATFQASKSKPKDEQIILERLSANLSEIDVLIAGLIDDPRKSR